MARTCESDRTVTAVASTPPNRTWSWPAAPPKLRPVIVTAVPPALEPEWRSARSPAGSDRPPRSRSRGSPGPGRTASMFHRSDGMPWKKMSEPLSATIRPYVFIAWAIAFASGDHVVGMTKVAFSRNRSPIRGRSGAVSELASCEAGKTNASSVCWTVIRMAWSMTPTPPADTGLASSGRARPGQDRQPGRVGGGRPDGAEGVGVQVPVRDLPRPPDAQGLGVPVGVARPRPAGRPSRVRTGRWRPCRRRAGGSRRGPTGGPGPTGRPGRPPR